jgi:hypothetical protein
VVEKIEKLNMTKSEIKSIRVLEFNGKTSDWEGWSEKFKARAKRKGYKDLLLGKKNIPTDNEYQQALTVSPETSSSKETIDLAELNEEAYEDIILSIDHGTKQGKVAFSLIKNCKTSDYPEGNCKLAWDRLVAKYAPKTAPSLLKLKKQFANSLLKNEVYPDEWITELESLRNDMDSISLSSKMNDQDFMIHILNNLPESYDVILDGMESRLMLPDSDPSKLTIENIRDKLNNRFERITKNELAKEEEHTLAAFNKQYKGRCSNCGEYGHKSGDCKDKRKGNPTFNGSCYYCGEKGHTKANCEVKRKADAINKDQAACAVEKTDDEEESVGSTYELGF